MKNTVQRAIEIRYGNGKSDQRHHSRGFLLKLSDSAGEKGLATIKNSTVAKANNIYFPAGIEREKPSRF